MQETLGEYLRRVRKERKLTLRGLEEKTGISNAYLSQIENGKIFKPSPSVLHKLAGFYGISYENLMKIAGYPMASRNQKTVLFRSSAGLEEITEEEEKELLEYLRFLRTRRSGK
jgi:transcriptional regulator with XRE-family HTH domain